VLVAGHDRQDCPGPGWAEAAGLAGCPATDHRAGIDPARLPSRGAVRGLMRSGSTGDTTGDGDALALGTYPWGSYPWGSYNAEHG
jgi:hypothetical protein